MSSRGTRVSSLSQRVFAAEVFDKPRQTISDTGVVKCGDQGIRLTLKNVVTVTSEFVTPVAGNIVMIR